MFIVRRYTAGNPIDSDVQWTNLKCSHISALLKTNAVDAGVYVVKQLLKTCGFVKRKMAKTNSLKETKNRSEQFEYIAELKEKFTSEKLPILSIDTKKKEMLGNFYRDGK